MTMGFATEGTASKPATAARIYDYILGGIHNFPADQEAARELISQFPFVPAASRANRAFLGRAVGEVAKAGVRQFLDIGSGIPTAGNVHEIAQDVTPDARVVYVDLDPVAVVESLEILEGNDRATAIRGDLRSPQDILGHPAVRRQLDLDQPVALLLVAVLHFVPDHAQAYDAVARLVGALAPGSFLVVSHAAAETYLPEASLPEADHVNAAASTDQLKVADRIYTKKTTTPGMLRTRAQTVRFFSDVELLDPGVVWLQEWRPDESTELADDPRHNGSWAGVGRKG
jgi:trans-aconitate methyltransferase